MAILVERKLRVRNCVSSARSPDTWPAIALGSGSRILKNSSSVRGYAWVGILGSAFGYATDGYLLFIIY